MYIRDSILIIIIVVVAADGVEAIPQKGKSTSSTCSFAVVVYDHDCAHPEKDPKGERITSTIYK